MQKPALAYDRNSRRKRTNLTVNEDLLALARRYDLNLSRLLEDRLVEELTVLWQRDWLESNRDAINQYNERISRDGVFSDGMLDAGAPR